MRLHNRNQTLLSIPVYLIFMDATDLKCPFCFGRIIWDNDFNAEDVYGEGCDPLLLVSFWHCTLCGATIQVDVPDESEVSA